jgi:hypothetical protein
MTLCILLKSRITRQNLVVFSRIFLTITKYINKISINNKKNILDKAVLLGYPPLQVFLSWKLNHLKKKRQIN